MSTPIRRYLVGRNVRVMGCEGMIMQPDGTLALDNNFTNFCDFGTFDTFEVEIESGLEEISGTDMIVENYVTTKSTWTATVGEIEAPSGGSKLMDVRMVESAYIYVEADVQDPVTGVGSVIQVLGVFGGITKGIKQGKNVVMATIRPCGYPIVYSIVNSSGSSIYTNANGGNPYLPQLKVGKTALP